MIKHLDGWDVAAYVRFSRQTHTGAIVIVEGAKDIRTYARLLDDDVVEFQAAGGKENAVYALDLLEEEGFPGVLAIVDADFDRLEDVEHTLENIFLTDLHDTDLMIANSRALNDYLNEYGDPKKVLAIPEGVYSLICNSIESLSYCRWASDRFGLMIDFKEMDFRFIDDSTCETDETLLLEYLISRSPAATCREDELAQTLHEMKSNDVSHSQLHNGHDFCHALGVAMRRLLGDLKPQQTYGKMVEGALRLAFNERYFRETKLYQNLHDWELDQPLYSLFAA